MVPPEGLVAAADRRVRKCEFSLRHELVARQQVCAEQIDEAANADDTDQLALLLPQRDAIAAQIVANGKRIADAKRALTTEELEARRAAILAAGERATKSLRADIETFKRVEAALDKIASEILEAQSRGHLVRRELADAIGACPIRSRSCRMSAATAPYSPDCFRMACTAAGSSIRWPQAMGFGCRAPWPTARLLKAT
jgi:hypothetical protein